ncbi:unnamed protein product [Peniophora sp. CBMAI 1063]|nr:unnamed protein product [Peniophora sp. CBMAI 1063]
MPLSDERVEEIIMAFGLIRQAEGEHLTAWETFWGVDIQEEEQPIWKQWQEALKPIKRNNAFTDLAKTLSLIIEDADLDIPPCQFFETSWKTALTSTEGRIAILSEFRRLEAQIIEWRGEDVSDDVVIIGQRGWENLSGILSSCPMLISSAEHDSLRRETFRSLLFSRCFQYRHVDFLGI